MKKIKILFITIFSILIMLPLLFINIKKDVISEIDNRKLLEAPKLENLGSQYLKNWQKYLDDRYGGRELAIDS